MSLTKELAIKICKDLGATPFSFGKIGITALLPIKEDLKTLDENNVTKYAPMWYGETKGEDSIVCCLLVLLEQEPDFDVCCAFMFKDFNGDVQEESSRIGFRYSWDDDDGVFLVKTNNKWLPMVLAQKLQLALGMEVMVQDGISWTSPDNDVDDLKKNISEILSLDE